MITELKYIIGTIFRLFTVSLPEGRDNKVLELADVFSAASKSGHCWLHFNNIDN